MANSRIRPTRKLLEHPSLPLPPQASRSVAGRTMQESTYDPRPRERLFPEDAPNVVVILIDDAGPGLPDTFGGMVHTPNLTRVLSGGVGFNRFHTTAMCSPTRAALLTGRNHHHAGSGQVTELSNDWDGYAGEIPRDCATLPEILRGYGYATSAFGKWHNTPTMESTEAGPFHNWPTSRGFDYFYGFLGGEASQYEPNLVRNTTSVQPPASADEGYHLTEDLADDAIGWLRRHKSLRQDSPFFLYWASGATHGPHQVPKEWADRYSGAFDDGWDAYRERTFQRAKAAGWIPDDAQLTERDETMPAWDDIPEDEKPFQRRLMEVFAGFGEHVDAQVGRLLDALEALDFSDNTIVFYIWGDNGSAGGGQYGTISGYSAQNGIRTTVREQIDALETLGGLDVLGSPLTDNQYHAGWAWAGSTPYKGLKLLASHFGGTRNPLAVQWPAAIKPDATPRRQFTHCNDIAPTVLDILGITPPREVNGIHQEPMDGMSFATALEDPDAPALKRTQYFEIAGSRGIYHDEWYACARGPRLPWVPGMPPGIRDWTPDQDTWELYDLSNDWSQANDLAAEHPERLAALQDLFLIEATRNKALPVGGGLWVMTLHPEQRIQSPYTEWEFFDNSVRIPEVAAPRLGYVANEVTIDATFPELASGVLYKLGGNGGGLTLFVDRGRVHFEYNLFLVRRFSTVAESTVTAGRHTLTVRTTRRDETVRSALDITIGIDGEVVGVLDVPESPPLFFAPSDCLDVGRALGSPVSLAYHDRVPFAFNGSLHRMHVRYL